MVELCFSEALRAASSSLSTGEASFRIRPGILLDTQKDARLIETPDLQHLAVPGTAIRPFRSGERHIGYASAALTRSSRCPKVRNTC